MKHTKKTHNRKPHTQHHNHHQPRHHQGYVAVSNTHNGMLNTVTSVLTSGKAAVVGAAAMLPVAAADSANFIAGASGNMYKFFAQSGTRMTDILGDLKNGACNVTQSTASMAMESIHQVKGTCPGLAKYCMETVAELFRGAGQAEDGVTESCIRNKMDADPGTNLSALEIAGIVVGALVVTGGAVYGGKKLYDKLSSHTSSTTSAAPTAAPHDDEERGLTSAGLIPGYVKKHHKLFLWCFLCN